MELTRSPPCHPAASHTSRQRRRRRRRRPSPHQPTPSHFLPILFASKTTIMMRFVSPARGDAPPPPSTIVAQSPDRHRVNLTLLTHTPLHSCAKPT
ncbi:hypothetical protein COCVIDRAFT_94601 [Bipolaris victoriae FI3]|uniref:Uncharacterized protein n=1 Tax=Bipolaris victoriae (strain FI3) TaxID=930091 RepID=W7ES14_BIPV3|nr:hypothetical protein COCVIDRAFT_94601 [Bipolaris victoriae FI3]